MCGVTETVRVVIQIHMFAGNSHLARIWGDPAGKGASNLPVVNVALCRMTDGHAALAMLTGVTYTVESLQLVDSLEELLAVLVVSLLDESVKCVTFID